MVDREIFSRRLAALRNYSASLQSFRAVTEDEFVANPALHHLAERYLHLAMECALDLANHFIADAGLATPETNQDSFTRLEEAGELAPELGARLRAWAGFRNVLVHEYLAIDHRIAWRAIQHELGDLDSLADWAATKLG